MSQAKLETSAQNQSHPSLQRNCYGTASAAAVWHSHRSWHLAWAALARLHSWAVSRQHVDVQATHAKQVWYKNRNTIDLPVFLCVFTSPYPFYCQWNAEAYEVLCPSWTWPMHISDCSDVILVHAKPNSFYLSLPKGLKQSYCKGDVAMGPF